MVLDGGSQRSFISKRLSSLVGAVQVGVETMNVNVFEHGSTGQKDYRKMRVRLFDRDGNNSVEVVLREIDSVCSRYALVPGEWIKREMSKRGLMLADPGPSAECELDSVDILIGGDLYWAVVTGAFTRLTERLVAIESLFGWLLHGPDGQQEASVLSCIGVESMHVCLSESSEDPDYQLCREVEQFWRLENLGITEDEPSSSLECDPVEQDVYDTIQYHRNRYMVRLPWNKRKGELCSNKARAIQRFYTLARRYLRDEKISDYHNAMMEYVKGDHAEVVSDTEDCGEVVYYIPHQAVIRSNRETTKLRVVFDASSGNPSLPHLYPEVLDLLLRFRLHSVAITADMEKAFLQIEIDPCDRDAVRFLWLPETWKQGDPIIPVTYRMTSALFGLNCGPFLLAATIKFHLQQVKTDEPDIVKGILRDTYVDDLVKSVNSESEGVRIYYTSKKIMTEGGFNMRKWTTNSSRLREIMAESEGDVIEFTGNTKHPTGKVLGMKWDPHKDVLQIDLKELVEFLTDKPPSKRMARVFDPMGLISPFTIRLKCLFQELWWPWRGRRLGQWRWIWKWRWIRKWRRRIWKWWIWKSKWFWRICVVKDIIQGRDGQVRACMVKTQDGRVIKRPVTDALPSGSR